MRPRTSCSRQCSHNHNRRNLRCSNHQPWIQIFYLVQITYPLIVYISKIEKRVIQFSTASRTSLHLSILIRAMANNTYPSFTLLAFDGSFEIPVEHSQVLLPSAVDTFVSVSIEKWHGNQLVGDIINTSCNYF